MKTWYCVTSSVDNRGRMTAAITESVQAATCPPSTCSETRRRDVYRDYFGTREEAAVFVEEARSA